MLYNILLFNCFTVQKLQEGYEFHLITFAANGGETAACGPWCFA